jgi:hypothetical protein
VISHIHEKEIDMGYEVPATRPGRPTVVTAAVACLFVLAGIGIISAIVTLVSYGPMIDAARDYAGGTTEGDATIVGLQVGRFAGFGIGVLFAIGYAVLGMFVGRGKNAARIIAWVVLGIGLCCNAGSLIGTAASGLLQPGASSDSSIDPEELQRRMEAALPGWADALTYIVVAVSIIAALAAVILLALPAANEFFRRREPVWEPPVPGSVYPAPGQPNDQIPPAPPEDPNRPGGGFAPPGP